MLLLNGMDVWLHWSSHGVSSTHNMLQGSYIYSCLVDMGVVQASQAQPSLGQPLTDYMCMRVWTDQLTQQKATWQGFNGNCYDR